MKFNSKTNQNNKNFNLLTKITTDLHELKGTKRRFFKRAKDSNKCNKFKLKSFGFSVFKMFKADKRPSTPKFIQRNESQKFPEATMPNDNKRSQCFFKNIQNTPHKLFVKGFGNADENADVDASFEYLKNFDIYNYEQIVQHTRPYNKSYVKQPSMGVSAYSINAKRSNTPSSLHNSKLRRSSFYRSNDNFDHDSNNMDTFRRKSCAAYVQTNYCQLDNTNNYVHQNNNYASPPKPILKSAARRRIFSTGILVASNATAVSGYSTDV